METPATLQVEQFVVDKTDTTIRHLATIVVAGNHVLVVIQDGLLTVENVQMVQKVLNDVQYSRPFYNGLIITSIMEYWGDEQLYLPDEKVLNRQTITLEGLVLKRVALYKPYEDGEGCLELCFEDDSIFGWYPVLADFSVSGEFRHAEIATW